METLPDKLVRLMAARDEPQSRVARAIEVDPSQYAKWLKGKGRPTVPQLLGLARHFGVPMEFLADDAMVDPPPLKPPLAPDEQTVVTVYRVLRDAGTLDVEGAIRALSGPPQYDAELVREIERRKNGKHRPA